MAQGTARKLAVPGRCRFMKMKNTTQRLAALVFIAYMSGCASTKPYLVDRGRDAADIFTASVGVGGGVKARVGPLQLGLWGNKDVAGLRGGTMSHWPLAKRGEIHDLDFLLFPIFTFGFESFDPSGNAIVEDRGKGINSIKTLPFVSLPMYLGDDDDKEYDFSRERVPFFTQIEFAAGLGGTVRLGFNPGELIDFILGWTTIDIFNDDMEKKNDTSNELSQSIVTEAAPQSGQ